MAGSAKHHSLDMRTKLEFPLWYRSFAKTYTAWAGAPSDLKTPLLLQGPALAMAESWLLAAPDKLSESQKRFIVRSIAQRARGGQSAGVAGAANAGKRWLWRRSSDRSLWHLYAVIALGLWMISPDIVRDLMEQALNPPDIYKDIRGSEVAGKAANPTGRPTVGQKQAGANAVKDAPAPMEVAEAAVEAAPDGDVDETPPIIFHQSPAAVRAERLAGAMQQQLAGGQSRAALLIGIEAAEAALEAGETGKEAARTLTALLTRAPATRDKLAPLALRSAAERTAAFCDERTLLTLDVENSLAVWRPGSSRRVASQSLYGASLDSAGLDRQCSRVLVADLDFNVEVRPILGGRTIAELHGHEATITAANFSPDGSAIVTASKDGTARIWNARSGRMRHLLSGHDWHVTGAEFSPDGRRVLTAASDKTARIWDAATGKEIVKLDHHGVVTSARFSADGRFIVTAAWDGFVRIWDGATGKVLQILGQPGGLDAAEASRDGRHVATALSAGGLQVWDAHTGRALHAINAVGVKQMMFTADSRRLIVLSWTNGVEIYDVASGALVAGLAGADEKVVAVRPVEGGRALAGITESGLRLVWPVVDNLADAIAQAKAIAPPCLTHDERATHGMEGDPPVWCAGIRPRDAALPATPGGDRQ